MRMLVFLLLLVSLKGYSLLNPFQPLSFDWNETDMYADYAGQTVLLFFSDTDILRTVQQNTIITSPEFWQTASDIGNGKYLLPGSYVLSLILDQDKDIFAFLTGPIMQAFLLSGVTAQILKYSIGRSRPYRNLGPYEFSGLSLSTKTHSFPSGHCQAVFSVAAVMSDEYHLGYILYPAAFLVAVSRIYNNKHWASDVLAGALIGIAAAKIVERKPFPLSGIFGFWYSDDMVHMQYSQFFNFSIKKKFDFFCL